MDRLKRQEPKLPVTDGRLQRFAFSHHFRISVTRHATTRPDFSVTRTVYQCTTDAQKREDDQPLRVSTFAHYCSVIDNSSLSFSRLHGAAKKNQIR